MTRRQARLWIIGWVISFFLTIAAFWVSVQHWRKPKPAFVAPIIWRDLYTGGEKPLDFDI